MEGQISTFAKLPLRTFRDGFLELQITLHTNPIYCVAFIDRISNIAETVVPYPKECLTADNNQGVLEIPPSRFSFTCGLKVRTADCRLRQSEREAHKNAANITSCDAVSSLKQGVLYVQLS